MNLLKSKSIFMLLLIICLPFYIGDAYAITPDQYSGELKEIRVYGNENATKALRPDSMLYIDALVGKANLSPSRLTFTEGQTFNTCVPYAGGSKCTLALTPATALDEGIKDYTITYFPPEGTPYSLSGSYVVDGTPPKVNTFRVTPSVVGKDELTISYSAVDYAGSTAAFCAGLAGFEIASDPLFQTLVTDVKVEPADISDCAKTGTLKVAAPTKTGQYIWYARAYDRLGNFDYGFKQTTFEVDADAPVIGVPRLYKAGTQLNFTGVGTFDYELRIEITDAHGLKDVPVLDIAKGIGVCDQLGPTAYDCAWPVIETTDSTKRTITGKITAEDTVGNKVEKTISVGVGIDESAPLIGFFGSEYGEYIKAKNNTLKLHAQEQESGFDKSTVYADLHLINSAYGTTKHPDKCDKEWCYWYNIDTPKSEGTYTARVFISDLVGHLSFADTTFTLDKTAPVIKNIVQTPEFSTAEEPLFFILNATDNTGISRAAANISDISSDKISVAECVEEDNLTTCVFEATGLKTYASSGNIKFTITDNAGNTVSQVYKMTLYEADYNSVPNELTVTVRQTQPASITKEVAENIPTKLFVGLDIEYKNKDVQIIGMGQPNCLGLQQLNLLVNTGSDNPYWVSEDYMVFVIQLDNATAALSNIELNCTADFIVRKNTKIFYNPERENIFANVSIISATTIDDNLVDRIDGIERNVNDVLSWAKQTNDILQSMIQVCDAFNAFKDVYDFMQTVKPVIYGVLSVLYAYPYTRAAANEAWKGYSAGVCYVAVAKNYAWPNTDPANLGALAQEKLTGGAFGEFKGYRGWVRNICAFVKCRQCNTDWSFVNDLVNIESVEKTELFGQGGMLQDVDLSVGIDPFKSWAVSLSCLCLPGVVYNVEKYRQIECIHARCLIENAKLGQSTGYCDNEDAVRKCVFWYGGLLQLVPGYLFAQMVISKITAILTNLPVRLILAAKGKFCDVFDHTLDVEGLVPSGPEKTSAGRAQEATDCVMEYMPTLPNYALSGRFIACSMLDAGLLLWSWNDVIDNAFDFKKYTESNKGEDMCEKVDWKAVD
jgi:hypothetical protein